ncbi:MAG: ABC transporter ATP-binding protein, partial [Vicinamibacterales bacterium]
MLSWPMIAFGWVTNLLQRGVASWERMLTVMNEPPQPSEGTVRAGRRRGAVEIRNLTFAYGARPVLHDICLRIEPGQTVAVVGPTGSGKSTLVSLLPRLVEPPPGTVFIDGDDVRALSLADVRAAIGMVPQEPFLFSETIGNNVAFGLSESDRALSLGRIERSARIARLDKDVGDFPHGYDTLVGERGLTLSGGQKQRTALARALALDPPILILDDALSAVDTYTEEEILRGLRGVMRERTSLIVSHRVSTVRDADVIVVLVDGRIVDRGRHAELVTRGGFYAELYRKQLLEAELAAS